MSSSASHNDPNRYSFDLENGIRIFFSVGTNGSLKKIGDGSFGVVFEGKDMAGNPVAIKVLYNTQSLGRRTGAIIVDPIIEQLENADFPLPNAQELKNFLDQHSEDSLSNLILKLAEKKQELFEAPRASKEDKEKWWTMALELIESDSSHTLAVARFGQEMDISRRLLEKYKPGLLGSVVKVSGGTRKFLSSKAGKNLAQEFEKLHIRPSNYAVVTDLYETSLERLMVNGPSELLGEQPNNAYSIRPRAFRTGFTEQQRIELEKLVAKSEEDLRTKIKAQTNIDDEAQKNSLESEIYLRVGYELLRVMTFENRVRIILPILKEIVNGLIPVHSTGLFHLDLKPANVFIRGKTHKEFAVAIGDFGYLDPQITGQTSKFLTNDPHAELALGTLHYRSPEQRDFFDMCDVVVKFKENHQVVLEVHDPKFRSTLIEKYDIVVFSKDSERRRYTIDDIKIDPEPDRPSCLYLLGDYSKDRVFNDSERTQIFLYKTPGLRSDLFGIGAIAYNLLTAGESPEHFYDHIRRFESRASGVPGEVEADVMDSYERFKHGLREDEQGLTTAFETFMDPTRSRDHDRYAPDDIVRLIFKCMLYKANGTYYAEAKQDKLSGTEKDLSLPAKKLMEDIDRLLQQPKYKPPAESPLMTLNVTLDDTSPAEQLSDQIEKLKGYAFDKNTKEKALRLRLWNGVWLLRMLANFVRKKVLDRDKENIGSYEILPKNLQIIDGNQLREISPTIYLLEQRYKEDIKRDELRSKINRDVMNPFVPDSFVSIRRMIQLYPSREGEDKDIYRYTLEGSSPFPQDTVNGWVVIDGKLLRVESAPQDPKFYLSAKPDDEANTELLDNIKEGMRYVYYERIDPGKYYLEILSLYLYHLIFAELLQFDMRSDKPKIRHLMQGAKSLVKPKIQGDRPLMNREQRHIAQLDDIFDYAIYIYLRLAFHGHESSFYQRFENNHDRVAAVITDIDELRKRVAKFLNVDEISKLEFSGNEADIEADSEDLERDKAYLADFEDKVRKRIVKRANG